MVCSVAGPLYVCSIVIHIDPCGRWVVGPERPFLGTFFVVVPRWYIFVAVLQMLNAALHSLSS